MQAKMNVGFEQQELKADERASRLHTHLDRLGLEVFSRFPNNIPRLFIALPESLFERK